MILESVPVVEKLGAKLIRDPETHIHTAAAHVNAFISFVTQIKFFGYKITHGDHFAVAQNEYPNPSAHAASRDVRDGHVDFAFLGQLHDECPFCVGSFRQSQYSTRYIQSQLIFSLIQIIFQHRQIFAGRNARNRGRIKPHLFLPSRPNMPRNRDHGRKRMPTGEKLGIVK